jgi:transketolase
VIELTGNLEKSEKFDFRDSIFCSIEKLFRNDTDVVVLTNDMGAMGLDKMREIDPTRVINVGITEQNMMSVASGLALSGKYVFVYGIISHIIFRALEQIKLDICVQNLPICLVGVGAGLAYGVDGPTHHGTEDIGVISALPNMEIFNPSDDCSAQKSVEFSYALKTPCFIRMDKEQLPRLYTSDLDLNIGFEVHGNGTDFIIFSSGMTTWSALKAKELLHLNYSKNGCVVDMIRLKNYNHDLIVELVKKHVSVYIVDESSKFGGFASLITRKICGVKSFSLDIISLEDSYLTGSAKREWAWGEFGLDHVSIMNLIRKVI